MIFLYILVVGLFAGWLASIVLNRGATRAQQLIAGLVGSVVGGTAANLLAGDGFDLAVSGLLGSIAGAIVVLAVWRPRVA
jgi:uncharacterized membrane protein YeaQ/YmgE (transglycosylase-associated protein family)